MHKKLVLYSLLVISLLFSFSQAMESDHWRERAKPVSVLTVPYYNAPPICRTEDFVRPCNTRDQVCKTRKEKCGDAIGAQFNEDLLSVENNFTQMSIHNGKSNSIHGIDDYRTTVKHGQVTHHFTENKAHTSQLNRKTNQASNEWHEKKLNEAHRSGNLPTSQYTLAKTGLERGETTRAVARTTLNNSQSGPQHFQMSWEPVISAHPDRRSSELYTYCTTMHEPIKILSENYIDHQSGTQRQELARLDRVCKQVTSTPTPISVSYNYTETEVDTVSRPTYPVSYARTYDRTNLFQFLTYLYKDYTYETLAEGSPLSASTIRNLIQNRNHALNNNYKNLWDFLKKKFRRDFGDWRTIPY